MCRPFRNSIQVNSPPKNGLCFYAWPMTPFSPLWSIAKFLLIPARRTLQSRAGLSLRFTSRAELRGCVGYILPVYTVYRAVAETARAAAFDDNRFPPVNQQEAPHLEIQLSILSSPQSIQPEEIDVGRHGLLISGHGRRGLLLPQVPIEHGWDRIVFLEQTCRKAGLPTDAWRKGAIIEAFTAEVFGEKSH